MNHASSGQRLAISMLMLFLSCSSTAGRQPIYQLYSQPWNDYFYTVDPTQRAIAIAPPYNYADNGAPFWVEGSAVPGAVNFSRFYLGAPQTDHFYTISQDDIALVLRFGWTPEGSEGLLYPVPVAGSVAVHRLNYVIPGTADLTHFYTINAQQVSDLQLAGWGYDGVAGYAFAGPGLPATQPRMVHATPATSPCADKFCVRLSGYNFAPNAWITVRRDSSSGAVMGVIPTGSYARIGDVDTMDVNIVDQTMRDQMNATGIWLTLVNPGDPPAWSGGYQVIRDNTASLYNWIDIMDGNRLAGWVCASDNFPAPLSVTVRVGSDTAPGFNFVADATRADVAPVCGGYGNHGFDRAWPAAWKDGQTREIYITALLPPPDSAQRFPNILLTGAPRFVTFPNIPFDATVVAVNAPAVMVANSLNQVRVTVTNVGNRTWTAPVSLLPSTVTATSAGVPMPQPVPPDTNVDIAFSAAAPAAEGTYTLQWRLSNGSSFFGQAMQATTQVVSPPTIYPTVTFPTLFQF